MTAKFIAHRGLSGRYPENTHAAFRAAWDNDCDGIELDIQVSRDGQVLVIHDPDTQRTSGQYYEIAACDYQTLQAVNVGLGGQHRGKGGGMQFKERIPLLSEVLAEMPNGKIVQIEIKHHIENMAAVTTALADMRDDIIVQVISFDPEKLLRVRRELPQLACFLVMDADTPPLDNRIGFAVENGFVGIDIDYQMASPEQVDEILAAGLKLAHWTVNDAETAARLIAQGAQFIASDFADALKRDVAVSP